MNSIIVATTSAVKIHAAHMNKLVTKLNILKLQTLHNAAVEFLTYHLTVGRLLLHQKVLYKIYNLINIKIF